MPPPLPAFAPRFHHGRSPLDVRADSHRCCDPAHPEAGESAECLARAEQGRCRVEAVARQCPVACGHCALCAAPPPPPCDEAAALSAQCGRTHQRLADELREWRGRRGLVFEFTGQSFWGIGTALSNAYLLFDICWQLRRYCYIRLYDNMALHELMGYATDGLSWAPPNEAERALYDQARHVNLTIPRLLRNPLPEHALARLSAGDVANASLLTVRTRPGLDMRFDMHFWLPNFPGDADLTWVNKHPRMGEDGQMAPFHIAHRCFFRFVTHPRRVPRRNVRSAKARARPTVTYHLRTGFADLEDPLLARLRLVATWPLAGADDRGRPLSSMAGDGGGGSGGGGGEGGGRGGGGGGGGHSRSLGEMARWLALACPLPAAKGLRDVRVLSDSPVVARHLADGSVWYAAARAPKNGSGGIGTAAADKGDVALLRTTRSWRIPLRAQQEAFDEMHEAGLSTRLYVSNSAFLRPLIARSVCVREVLPLTHRSSLCPRFADIFPRAFFGLVNFHVGLAKRYNETRSNSLSADHPCKALDETACAAHYVASVTGRPVAQAAAAARCRKVLTGRDCVHLPKEASLDLPKLSRRAARAST
jgi:uncharacterized membrane protein YgcG